MTAKNDVVPYEQTLEIVAHLVSQGKLDLAIELIESIYSEYVQTLEPDDNQVGATRTLIDGDQHPVLAGKYLELRSAVTIKELGILEREIRIKSKLHSYKDTLIKSIIVMVTVSIFLLAGLVGTGFLLKNRLTSYVTGITLDLGDFRDKFTNISAVKDILNVVDSNVDAEDYIRIQAVWNADPELLFLVGKDFMSVENPALAINYFERALLLDPDNNLRKQLMLNILVEKLSDKNHYSKIEPFNRLLEILNSSD